MKNLTNFSNSALTRSEMKNIKGGDSTYSCTCTQGSGGFTFYGNVDDYIFYSDYYCPNGAAKCN